MFNILSYNGIVNHLNRISPNMFKQTSGEIVIHCPYCGDADRSNAGSHGHLYLAKDSPVFHCFRCDESGTLVRLLSETGFTDAETLSHLKRTTKFYYSKDYYDIDNNKKTKIKDFKLKYNQRIIEFEKTKPQDYQFFSNYIHSRIGRVEFSDFLLYPNEHWKKPICEFYNLDGECSVKRYTTGDLRYFEKKSIYYFQNFDNAKKIVLAEGPFDIINLYLYNNKFKDCHFISINGKSYTSVLEKLIQSTLLLGEYEIHLVYDTDNPRYKQSTYGCKALAKIYNKNISIRSWLPCLSKDTGDIPFVEETS
jgi:hypothetical protein